MLWVLICTVHLTVCYYHVTYEFQSESKLYCLPECQGTSCLKQAPYLKFKWQQRDSNLQPLNSQTNTQPFSQTGQIVTEYGFTLNFVRDMIITYSQVHRADKYSQHISIMKPSLAKWLSVRLWIKWLWVRISLLTPKLQMCRLLRSEVPWH